MSRLFAIPVGLLLLALVTAVERTAAFHNVRADPSALLVAYLAFRFDVVGGMVSALVLGACLDATSGAPLGLHMLGLALLFVIMRGVANAVQVKPGLRLLPMALGAAFLHAMFVAVLVQVFGSARVNFAGIWQSGLPSVLVNAALGVIMLPAVDALARRVSPEPDHMFLRR